MLRRYERQMMMPEVGQHGQELLERAQLAVIGCGGLGTAVSDLFVRAGVGTIRIVDGDIVELSNLQRQSLYDEEDVSSNLPKAIIASAKLSRVNSQTTIEPIIARISDQNVEQIIYGMDLIVDGTDNFETRYLINDACVKHNIPWVFASVGGVYGMTMLVVPGKTACLRCFCHDIPNERIMDDNGIWSPVVKITAALEVAEGLKLLIGKVSELHGRMIYIDAWRGNFESLKIRRLESCQSCAGKSLNYL